MEVLLQRFANDEHGMQAVLQYVTDFIAREGVTRMFDRKDVSAIADAKELIDKAFDQMSIDYGISPKKETRENDAR